MNLIKMRVQIDTFCRLVSYQWKLITIQKFKKHTQKEDTTLICQSCTCLQNLNPNKMTLPFQAEKRSVQTGIACLEVGGGGGGGNFCFRRVRTLGLCTFYLILAM